MPTGSPIPPCRPGRGARAVSVDLLALYASACSASVEAFERTAIAQLGRIVGFDGAVWGRGSPLPDGRGVRIDTAAVLDRNQRLLHDYAHAGQDDPVAGEFFARPASVQRIDVGAFYRAPPRQRIGDCLNAHDIGQLMLGGGRDRGAPCGAAGVYSWITVYRREVDAPFTPREAACFGELLPHWVQAREVCAELTQARTPPVAVTVPVAVAARSSRAENRLSPRESEVLVLVARGFTYVEAAAMMGLACATVQSHARNLYGKLGAHNKTEAVFEARALGWID